MPLASCFPIQYYISKFQYYTLLNTMFSQCTKLFPMKRHEYKKSLYRDKQDYYTYQWTEEQKADHDSLQSLQSWSSSQANSLLTLRWTAGPLEDLVQKWSWLILPEVWWQQCIKYLTDVELENWCNDKSSHGNINFRKKHTTYPLNFT